MSIKFDVITVNKNPRAAQLKVPINQSIHQFKFKLFYFQNSPPDIEIQSSFYNVEYNTNYFEEDTSKHIVL